MNWTTPPTRTWSRMLRLRKYGPRFWFSCGPGFKFQANVDHKIAWSEAQDEHLPRNWTTLPACEVQDDQIHCYSQQKHYSTVLLT